MNQYTVLFIDEAVFSSRLQQTKVWSKNYIKPPVVFKSRIGFQAVAVTGAINMDGEVIQVCAELQSINVTKFIEFLKQLRAQYAENEVLCLFLDNLRVHYSKLVKQYCEENHIKLVFNAAYSSEFNPIERLWALAKNQFAKMIVETDDLSQKNIKSLVLKSLNQAPTAPLKKYVELCIRKMKDHIRFG